MTEDNTTEAAEAQESNESGEENALIKSLREQIKEKDKQLKSVPNRSDIESEVRSAVERENAIAAQLVARKIPTGIRSVVEEKLGDAEVSAEAVDTALKALGFEITDSDESGTEESPAAQSVSDVADLGGQVQAAAQNVQPNDIGDKIAAAETPEELARVMREAGLGS